MAKALDANRGTSLPTFPRAAPNLESRRVLLQADSEESGSTQPFRPYLQDPRLEPEPTNLDCRRLRIEIMALLTTHTTWWKFWKTELH